MLDYCVYHLPHADAGAWCQATFRMHNVLTLQKVMAYILEKMPGLHWVCIYRNNRTVTVRIVAPTAENVHIRLCEYADSIAVNFMITNSKKKLVTSGYNTSKISPYSRDTMRELQENDLKEMD